MLPTKRNQTHEIQLPSFRVRHRRRFGGMLRAKAFSPFHVEELCLNSGNSSTRKKQTPTCRNSTPRPPLRTPPQVWADSPSPEIAPFPSLRRDRANRKGSHSSHQPAPVQLPEGGTPQANGPMSATSFADGSLACSHHNWPCRGSGKAGCHPTKNPPAQRLAGATMHNPKTHPPEPAHSRPPNDADVVDPFLNPYLITPLG